MSLTVPLAVRIVTARQDRHITRDLRDLSFRSVVPGGFASLTMSFDRPLHVQPDEIDYYASVIVYGMDGRVAWEGRLEDPGRGASADGLVWEVAAVGPSAHAEDLTKPIIYIDQSVDRWRRQPATLAALETGSESVLTSSDPGWRMRFPRGVVVNIATHGGIEYHAIRETVQSLARIAYTYQMGVSDTNLRAKVATVGTAGFEYVHDIAWTTTPASASRVVVTDWPIGRNLLSLDLVRQTSSLTVANDDTWVLFTSLIVVALRLNADGTEKTTGYTTNTVLASDVVADVVGRLCPEYDGANAAITTTSYGIQSLNYPDGANARQILNDMMGFEPAYYWAAWESTPLTARFKDFFERSGVNGWATADSGQIWTPVGGPTADYSVNGSQGVHSLSAINSSRRTVIGSGLADVDIRCNVRVPVLATGAPIIFTLLARYVDASNHYLFECLCNTDQSVTVRLSMVSGGAFSVLATTTHPTETHQTNDNFAIRFQLVGTTLQAKLWHTPDPEPGVWNVTATDATHTSGAIGCRSTLDIGNTNTLPVTVVWDNFFESLRPGGHRFEWVTWPTTVRYEADVVDGFDSPGSAGGLYNSVRVRWADVKGIVRTVIRTQTVRELGDASLVREAYLDIGSDRTQTDAEKAGDAFLTEHKAPPNAGRLIVARPIVDLVGGGMVHPWEIRPGNLIRVRGVLPSVDSLNATDRDGVTVFRIIGHTYRASSASAELELDSYPLTVARALADLQHARGRR